MPPSMALPVGRAHGGDSSSRRYVGACRRRRDHRAPRPV